MTKETIEGLPEELQELVAGMKGRSYDESRKQYMTESQLKVINFDRFSKYYCKTTGVAKEPTTNDALYKTATGKWVFIEFKNGTIKKDEIYRKIYDSLIMMIETGMIPDFAYARTQMSYILVYNKEIILQEKREKEQTSKDRMHRHMEEKADEIFCLFGLEKLREYLFEDTQTYTKEQFEKEFVEKYEKIEGIVE